MTWLELRNPRNLHLERKHAIPCGHQKSFDSSLKVSGFILKQKMSATNLNKSIRWWEGSRYQISCSMTWCAQPPGWQSQLLWANDLEILYDQSSGWRGQPAIPATWFWRLNEDVQDKKSLRSQQRQQLLQQQTRHLEHQVKWCKMPDVWMTWNFYAFQLELISFRFKNAATFLSRWIKNYMPAWI